jgi:hypothetical protein
MLPVAQAYIDHGAAKRSNISESTSSSTKHGPENIFSITLGKYREPLPQLTRSPSRAYFVILAFCRSAGSIPNQTSRLSPDFARLPWPGLQAAS